MLSYFLIFMMIVIGVFPMMWEMYRGRFDFFNLKNPFIIYYLLQLPVSGLVTLLTGTPSEIGLDPVRYSGIYEITFVISFMGLLFFQLGYYTQSSKSIKVPMLLKMPWVKNRYRWIVVLYLILGIGAFLLLLHMSGGLEDFLANREAFRSGGLVGLGIVILPATVVMTVAALVYFISNIWFISARRGIIKSVFVLIFALIPAFFMGFRSAIFLPVLQFSVVWNYGYRKIPTGKLIALGVLVIIAFTVYGIAREVPPGIAISASSLINVATKKPELIYTIVSRSKGAEVVASVINKLNQTGDYDLNLKSFIEAATIMIPRLLWKDKPQASSVRFTTYFFTRDLQLSRGSSQETWGGISPTVVGELYWHFGWIGVIVGLYFLGRLARVVYTTLQRNRTNSSVLVIYAVFYTSFAMFAEALQGYVNGLVMYSFVIIVTLFMLTRRLSLKPREPA